MNPHSTFRIIHYSLFSHSNGLLHTNFHQNPCGFPRISLFLLSLCSLLPICLATAKICSAKNETGKDSAPQTSPLDFSIVLQPTSLTTPVYTTNILPAWAQLLLPAGEDCASKTIMQIPQGHQSTNKHLLSQYHPLITSLSKYNSEQNWG